MSTFLGWSSNLISSGATSSSMQATFASLLTTTGATPWQVVRQAVIPTSIIGTMATPGNAFDMTSTTVATQATLPASVGANITAGFIPTYMYVQVGNSSSLNYAPITFTLDYSSNGSTWTTLQTFTGQINWQYAERRKYAITGATSQTYWRINITAVVSGTTCNIAGWTLEDINGNWLTTQNFFDCIPPTTETIGNSYSRDVLRWLFPSAGTSILLRSVQELLLPLPELYRFYTPTAGAVTLSITINSNTVSFVGSTSNTAIQNARGLYEACKTSTNANFLAWNWYWPTALESAGPGIIATQVTPAMNVAITSSNISNSPSTSVYTTPLVQGSSFSFGTSITTDVINGWIYYLQICSRGIAIASKTNAAYTMPIHACYGDNVSAISQIPVSDLAAYGLPCTIVELLVGYDDVVANTSGYGSPSHFWVVPSNTFTQTAVDTSGDFSPNLSAFTHFSIAAELQDFPSNINTINVAFPNNSYTATYYSQMNGEGLFNGADSGNFFSIHRLSCITVSGYVYSYLGSNNQVPARIIGPNYYNLDWYKFTGAAPTNEQLLISPCNDFTTTISSTGLKTDTTLTVASTSGFPTSGWLVLDGEIISYSSTTSTTFAGCVRGNYATSPITPIAGTTLYIAGWYCFIVQGLLFGGYIMPS